MNLYVTSDVNTTARVTVGQGAVASYPVTANSVTVIPISPSQAYVGSSEEIEKKAIHVTSDAPVVVYAHIYHLNKSGATLVLPTNTLGRSYYAVSYNQSVQEGAVAASQLMVVALEDNTTIEITPTATTLGGKPAGRTFSPPTLMKGDVYQVRSLKDLTGTKVESVSGSGTCKRIAVFSGSSYTAIPEPYTCPGRNISGDNLYQHLYPVSAWGKNFVTAPFMSRTAGDIYRVLASKDNTVVTVNGQSVTINQGQFHEFENSGANYISASEPVQVTHYTKSQACDGVLSDPDMVLVNPVEQTLNNITLYSSPNFQISSHYINITMKTANTGSFKLDGRPVSFSPVPSNPAYSFSQNQVMAGNHTLTADSGFNAFAYGLGSFESYAYSAGANVTNLNQNITVLSDSICDGNNIRFKGYAIYQPLAWKWYFGDGATSAEQNPSHTFPGPGKYTVSLVTTKSNGNDCDSQDSTYIEVEVFPNPVADFTYEVACSNESTRFKDASKATTGESMVAWNWNFGDGTTSTEQNPAHRYKSPGTYNVTLSVTSKNGCVSEVLTREVTILAPPVAKFIAPETCAKNTMVFQDQSTVPVGRVARWEWDFGDGSARSTEQHPQHVYPQAGTYTVKLKAFSDQGCQDSTQQTITINPIPVAAFSLPDICVRDEAAFKNESTIAAGTLSYHWDFGDGTTSTAPAPRHRYAKEGEYTVKLVVTSGKGCQDSVSHTYTISGATPVPNFTASSFCQEQGVNFQDASTIAFGKIIKRRWSFGDGTFSEETTPRHLYKEPGTYRVILEVWSGIVCAESLTKTIEVMPNPAAGFTTANVCEGTPARFTNTTQIRGGGALTYTWNFGDGTTSSEPSPAHLYKAPGTYTVALAVKAANSCEQSFTSSITVYPTPKADFSPSVGCVTDVVSFQDMSSLLNGNLTTWAWDFGDGTTASTQHPSHTYAREGTYPVKLTVSSALGCTHTITKAITISPAPIALAGPDRVICGAVTARLEANTPAPATGQWTVVQGTGGTFANAANPTTTFTGTMGGTYTLRWTVSNSPCVNATDEVEIRLRPTPEVSAGSNLLLVEGERAEIQASGQGKLTWSPATDLSDPAIANPIITASQTGTFKYYLSSVSEAGCPNVDSMTVTVIKRLNIPTAFSPNGDGSNDTWELEGIQDYPRISIEIYNRWGQQVYSTKGYPSPWDGKRNGSDLPIGAYYYIIDPHNGRPKITGPLTILR